MPAGPRIPIPRGVVGSPFTVQQGRSIGITPKRLRGRDLEKPFRGVRRAGVGDPTELDVQARLIEQCRALELVLPDCAYFSHLTAARLWPLPLPFAERLRDLHVSVPAPQRAVRRVGVVGHTSFDPEIRIVARSGRRVADAATIFLQLATALSQPELVAVGDAMVLAPKRFDPWSDRPWVRFAALRERVDRFHGRGKRRAAAALELIRPGAESRPETLLRLALVGSGLPEPEVNTDIVDGDGRFLARGDLVYRGFRVLVEYDGDQHRTSTDQFERDLGRLDDLAAAGWRVVRISGRAFFGDRERAIGRVTRALEAAGWRPDAS